MPTLAYTFGGIKLSKILNCISTNIIESKIIDWQYNSKWYWSMRTLVVWTSIHLQFNTEKSFSELLYHSPILRVLYGTTGIHFVTPFWVGVGNSEGQLCSQLLHRYSISCTILEKPALLELALMLCSYYSKFSLFETFVLLSNFSYLIVETKLGDEIMTVRFIHCLDNARHWNARLSRHVHA